MYRPALGGDVTAKIKCTLKPAMATVRINSKTKNDVIISVGKGAVDYIDNFRSYADKNGFGFGVSRPVVDTGKATYDNQIGLTGKNVNPKNEFGAVLVSKFNSAADLEIYKNHPEHIKVSALCKEIRTDRQAVDFEI